MLNVTELKNGTIFKENKELFQVVSYEHIKMGRGSGNVKVKAKNLKTGAVTEKSFMTGGRVEEASVDKRLAQYLYHEGASFYFMDPKSFEQFTIEAQILGEQAKFLTEGLQVNLLIFGSQVISLELPNSLIYTVSETGPGERGNTVSNVYKEATLDNGLVAKVPLFIKIGEKVKVDTRTGQYVERAK